MRGCSGVAVRQRRPADSYRGSAATSDKATAPLAVSSITSVTDPISLGHEELVKFVGAGIDENAQQCERETTIAGASAGRTETKIREQQPERRILGDVPHLANDDMHLIHIRRRPATAKSDRRSLRYSPAGRASSMPRKSLPSTAAAANSADRTARRGGGGAERMMIRGGAGIGCAVRGRSGSMGGNIVVAEFVENSVRRARTTASEFSRIPLRTAA